MNRPQLRLSLKLAAAYDAGLGLIILAAGVRIMGWLGESPDPYLFRLSALPLLILPVLYWTAARAEEVDDFRAPVLWARGGGGALILLLALMLRPPAPVVYLAVGILDLVWCWVHVTLWRRG